MPKLVHADTWDKAILLCNELYNDKNKLQDIIDYNFKWWENQIIGISEKINLILRNK